MNKTREQILNEAFIGKKPTDKLFGHWKDLTDFIKSHPHDPHLKEKCYLDFKKELSSLFGFDRTELVVIPTADVNAMTLPIRFDDEDLEKLNDLFIVNNKIIKINPKYKNSTFFFFYSELIMRLTAEESFAIFLHEVGHSFNNVLLQAHYMSTRSRLQKMIDYTLGAFNSVINKVSNTIKNALGTSNIYGDGSSAYNPYIQDYFDEVDRLIKDDKEYQKYRQWYGKMRDIADKQEKDIYNFGIFNSIVHILMSPILLPIGLITYMVGGNLKGQTEDNSGEIKSQWAQYYKNLENEYNADNFVSIYGYSKELSDAFLKFNDIYRNMKSTNGLETKILRCVVLLNRMTVTSHPNEYARVTTLMKHAEYELKNNKNITKEQRAELTKMLNGCKEVLDNLYKINSDINKSPLSIRIYNRMNNKLKDKYESDASKRDYDRGYREIQNAQQGKKINESTDLATLNEKFIGPKPIEKLHEYWTVLYNKLKNDEISVLANDDQDYINFKQEVCDMFGFGSFTLEIENLSRLNAFTMPIGFSAVDMYKKDLFLVGKDYIKINPKYNVSGYIVMSHSMFRLLECDEAFSVFLHEVGHNFNDVQLQVKCILMKKQIPGIIATLSQYRASVLSLINRTINQTVSTQAGDTINQAMNGIWNTIGSWDITKKIGESLNWVAKLYWGDVGMDKRAGFFSYITMGFKVPGLLLSIANTVTNKLWKAMSLQFPLIFSADQTRTIKAFDLENQSDNFPSMFGYGAPAASGLAKLEKIMLKSNVGWGILEGIQRLQYTITQAGMWCHPTMVNRLINIQKHLEYELKNNKNIDNLQRKSLEENLAGTKKALDDLLDISSDVGKMRPLTYKIWMLIQKRYLKVYNYAADNRDFEFGYDYLQKEQEELESVKECMLKEGTTSLRDIYLIYKE